MENEILALLRRYIRATETLDETNAAFAQHIAEITESAPIDIGHLTNACEEHNAEVDLLENEVAETWEALSQWAIDN